jgi:3-deoxy-D-manno-octulosonic-acid transferase
MMAVYSALLAAVLIVGAPYWLVRMATSGRYRAGLLGRLGRLPAGLREAVAGRCVIWVHAVSVGEVMAAARLVTELKELLPHPSESSSPGTPSFSPQPASSPGTPSLPGWVIAVSTTTETGQRLARERMAGMPVFYMPLDFRFSIRRYLNVLRPELVVLMESEFWPRLMRECWSRGIPIAVVNARVSDRSLPRYLRLRALWRPLLGYVSLFLAQSEENAERLRRIGAPAERVRVSGNLKYDVRTPSGNAMAEMIGSHLPEGARVVVCGSTLEGEERMLLDAWPKILQAEPKAVIVLAPRHPDRFKAVGALVETSGTALQRATEFRERPGEIAAGSVFLLDTIGDLAAVYSLGEVTFVGGSLVPAGGHNPLEPAQFGVPVVVGPSFENFREIVDAMQAKDAIRVVQPQGLAEALCALLTNRADAEAMGERGRRVFEAQAGATQRTVDALMELVERPR